MRIQSGILAFQGKNETAGGKDSKEKLDLDGLAKFVNKHLPAYARYDCSSCNLDPS
jgi:hypothetical protein